MVSLKINFTDNPRFLKVKRKKKTFYEIKARKNLKVIYLSYF